MTVGLFYPIQQIIFVVHTKAVKMNTFGPLANRRDTFHIQKKALFHSCRELLKSIILCVDVLSYFNVFDVPWTFPIKLLIVW